ncbi:MAG: glycosyltransferase family 39 protein [Planctomycetes bacterium]|nr:glycosyltransferase family 39 protein [Planctomycetota bacterium]
MKAKLETWLSRGKTWLSGEPQRLPPLAPDFSTRRRPFVKASVALFIIAGYLLLVNPYWHFTPDSGVYLALGRNLLTGRGYVFNGLPHAKYPGGMPYLLAALMRVSTTFLWLNFASCIIVLSALGLLYLLLRDIVDLPTRLLVTLLTAVSFWTHEYASSQMSEAPFLLASNAAILCLVYYLRPQCKNRAAALLGICAFLALASWFRAFSFFWAGPFAVSLLLTPGRRSAKSRLASALLIVAVLVGCLFVYRHWSHTRFLAAQEQQLLASEAQGRQLPPYRSQPNWTTVRLATIAWPGWFTMILAPQWRLLAKWGMPLAIIHAVDWMVLLVIALGVWAAFRRGQVFVGAIPLFLAPFAAFGWDFTWGRYAIGVIPFVIILFLMGVKSLASVVNRKSSFSFKPLTVTCLAAAVILCVHGTLFVGDVLVQRRRDFYKVYRGGVYAEMMGILQFLQKDAPPGDVGVQKQNMQAVPLLTGRRCVSLWPYVWREGPDALQKLRDFARSRRLRYLFTLDYTQPWPVWHIRRTARSSAGGGASYWQLWEYHSDSDELLRVRVRPSYDWPTRASLLRRAPE